MSTHAVKIVEITEIVPHTNADKLEIVRVGGWSAVVGKGQFALGDRAVYVEPDYVVPFSRPEFAFLSKGREDRTEHRMKAIRLRGQLSFGLLIPVPEDLSILPTGSDVMELLGIRRYEPPITGDGPADSLPESEWPQLYCPKFDLEDLRKHPDIFVPGEEVVVTEKIHGANARCVFHNGQFYVGTRNRWLDTTKSSVHTRAMMQPAREIIAWCQDHPDVILYGEVYGPVQELRYGTRESRFSAFAAMEGENWIDQTLLFSLLKSFGNDVEHAPILHRGPYDREKIAALAEFDSEVSSVPQLMEGIVIVPAQERRDPNIGRVALKLISNRYWES